MTDRFPLIVNASANQIQELPSSDSLQLGDTNKIKLGTDDDLLLFHDGSNGSINLANGSLTVRVHDTGGKGFFIEDPNGSSAQTIAKFEKDSSSPHAGRCELMHGGLKKFETTSSGVTVTGGLTVSAQPSCLLTVPVEYTSSTNNNGDPISFTNTVTNVGFTVTRDASATAGSGNSTITVPSAGTYLISACIGGDRPESGNNHSSDKIILALNKGSSVFPSEATFPTFLFSPDHFNCTFTLSLALSAGDALSVNLRHQDTSQGTIKSGYFSVTKLY